MGSAQPGCATPAGPGADAAVARRRLVIARSCLSLSVLVCAPPAVGAAAGATWKTHRDQNCGIEVKYPPSYDVKVSGAPDHCALWIQLGIKGARAFRALVGLEVRQMESVEREQMARSGAPPSVQAFALQWATARCSADGPDGTRYCTGAEVRSTFKTAQGFRVSEIHLTEVRETFTPKRIERRQKGPILALDLSDDEAIRVLMADAEPGRVGTLKAILDTLRVWTRARRSTPRVVELQPFAAGGQVFTVRVTPIEAGSSHAGDELVPHRSPRPPARTRRLDRRVVRGDPGGDAQRGR